MAARPRHLAPRNAKTVISIQSAVAYGHVGNSAAVLPLQRLGCEVWPIDTVHLAHHPAYGTWRGRVTTPEELSSLLDGLEARRAFDRCDALLSGYLGDASLGPGLIEAVRRLKRARPRALFVCDPVMGETGRGFYVREGIPAFFRDQALRVADILIPNAFELGFLAGRPVEDAETAVAAARMLLRRGPRLVVTTGLKRRHRGRPRIAALAIAARGAWRVETPLIDVPASGAGDAFAALFLGHFLSRREPTRALALATSAIHAVLARSAALGSGELALVAAQDELRAPKRLFKAERMG